MRPAVMANATLTSRQTASPGPYKSMPGFPPSNIACRRPANPYVSGFAIITHFNPRHAPSTGNSAPDKNHIGITKETDPVNDFLSSGIRPLSLTESEIDDLVAFMEALTSKRFAPEAAAVKAKEGAK